MQKSTNSQQGKSKTRRKRYTCLNELPEELQKAIRDMEITSTIESIGEFIHPDVKARLEEEKKNQSPG